MKGKTLMTPERIKELFQLYDRDQSGRITSDEFRFMCHDKLNVSQSGRMDCLLTGIFIAGDGEGWMNFNDHKLNIDEFTNIMSRFPNEFSKKDEDQCLNEILFDLVDGNKSGTIQFRELNRFLKKLGAVFSSIGSYIHFKENDVDQNGYLDRDEFFRLFLDITQARPTD